MKTIIVEKVFYDGETGELISSSTRKFDPNNPQNDAEKREAEQFKAQQSEKTKQQFIWMHFENHKPIFPELKPSDVTKLMNLATYTDSSGLIRVNKNSQFFSMQATCEAMKLSEKVILRLLASLKDAEIVELSDDMCKLSNRYFCKYDKPTRFGMAKKIFIKPMRSFYQSIPVNSHTGAANVFGIIPYLNWKYNIACEQVAETVFSNIVPYSFKELAEAMGQNREAMSHVVKLFDKYTFIENKIKKKAVLVHRVEEGKSVYPTCQIIMNPCFCYGGTKFSEAACYYHSIC